MVFSFDSSLDSLKSHHQRKHTVIGEKHELSDDNEKDDRIEEKEKPPKEDSNQKDSSVQSVNDNFEKEVPQSHNNNNNDNEPNANCTVCSQKTKSKTDSSSIAIQCEVSPISNENIETQSVQEKGEDATMEKIAVDNGNEKCNLNKFHKLYFHSIVNSIFAENHGKEGDLLNQEKNSDTEQIQNAYETISELKKEIVSLKNSLEAKIESEHPTTAVNLNNSASFVQTNDKIDVIEQKFNAFEVMYMESQHQFIESFRNLDERQKTYLDNIQETIKEIVEKSIGQHDSGKNDAKIMDIENKSVIQVNTKEKSTVEEANGLNNQNDAVALPKTEGETIQKRFEMERSAVGYDTSSYSEDDGREVTCEAEVHTISQSERHGSDQEDRKESKKNTKSNKKSITKDVAIHEFEHRLRQFGVDIDSAGLATPRSCEINQDLANERKEMRKAHRSFEKTRKQLRNEVDRMAKGKLASANSATSQSSYQSDQILDDSDEEGHRKVKNRPKSASVQRMRKRNAKKLMNKFVENDIDENDIIDKMQMAQAAISSHRQCIQQLLETTAHSPSSLTKIKYSSSIAAKEDAKTNNDADNTEPAINQYNKMPNVTTRRVVFVNLDEDS